MRKINFQLNFDTRSFGVIALIICLFFITKWVFRGLWFNNDLVTTTTALENLYGVIQRSGELPLWSPELAGGYPLLATGQLGFFYPLHMALRQFFPAVWTLNISMLIHSLLAAIGVFSFLRFNKVQTMASGMAALLLPLGAAFVGKYEMINLILPFTWVPLLFLFLQMFLKTGGVRILIYWILSSSLCVLVGHPQMAVIIFVLQAIFVLCLLVTDYKKWKRALLILISVFIVIGLTSFYWLPIVEVIPFTDRAQGVSTDEELLDFSFPIEALKGLVIPHPFGHGDEYMGPKNEAELSSYLGPITLLLSLFGLLVGRKSFRFLWLFSVVITNLGFVLALGKDSAVYVWLVDMGWRYFNSPARFFLFSNIGLILLSAIGFHWIVNLAHSRRMKTVLAVIILIGSIVPVFYVSWRWHDEVSWQATQEPEVAKFFNSQNSFVRVFSKERLSAIAPHNNFGIMIWNPIVPQYAYRQSFSSPFNQIDGINLRLSESSVVGEITLKLFDDRGDLLRKSSISTQNIRDGEWSTFSFEQLDNIQDQAMYFEITSDISQKQQASRLYIHTNPDSNQYNPTGQLFSCRNVDDCEAVIAGDNTTDISFQLVVSNDLIKGYELLAPYTPAGFGINTAQWTGPLPLYDVSKYLEFLGDRGSGSAWQDNRSLVNRFPITHVIGLYPPYRFADNLLDFEEVSEIPLGDKIIRTYENKEAFPRVHFVRHVQASADSSKEQKNILLDIDSQDINFAVASVSENMDFAATGEVLGVQDNRNTVAVQVKNEGDGFLVMRDVLFPGWKAYVDGNEVPVYRTDSIFRGVYVPGEAHEVVFVYKPRWIQEAFIITGISLAIMLLMGLRLSRKGAF